eukprot:gene3708-3971_t
MDTPICTCVQNLMSSDCARARVGLCTRRDPLCIPFQDIFSSDNSSAARAVGVAAAVLDKDCLIPEPVVPGVRASLEFPGVSMAAYIAQSYSLTVANALSSVADISSTAVSTVDVRPRAVATPGSLSAIQAIDGSSKSYLMKTITIEPSFTAKAIFHHPASTYFLRTDDPITVSHKLSAAANEGTLSSRLEQYGIPTEVSGMHIEIYMLPTGQLISTPPGSAGVSKASNSSQGNWVDELGTNSIGYALALVAIVAGGAMLCAVLIYAGYRCWRRKQNKQNKQTLISWNSNSKLARKGAMSVTVAKGAVSEKHTVEGAAGDAQAGASPTASKPAGDPPNPSVRRQNLPRCFDYPAPAADFAVQPFFRQPEICSATSSAEFSSGEVTPTSDSDAQSSRATFHQVQPISSTLKLPSAAGAAREQMPGVIKKPNSQQLLAYEHLAGAYQGTNADYSSKLSNGQPKQQQLASGIAGAALKLPSTATRASGRPSFTRTSSGSAEETSNLVSGLNKQAAAAPAYSMGRQAFSTWYHAAAAVVAATMEPTPEVQAEIVAPAATSKLQSGYTAGTTAAQLPRAGEDPVKELLREAEGLGRSPEALTYVPKLDLYDFSSL